MSQKRMRSPSSVDEEGSSVILGHHRRPSSSSSPSMDRRLTAPTPMPSAVQLSSVASTTQTTGSSSSSSSGSRPSIAATRSSSSGLLGSQLRQVMTLLTRLSSDQNRSAVHDRPAVSSPTEEPQRCPSQPSPAPQRTEPPLPTAPLEPPSSSCAAITMTSPDPRQHRRHTDSGAALPPSSSVPLLRSDSRVSKHTGADGSPLPLLSVALPLSDGASPLGSRSNNRDAHREQSTTSRSLFQQLSLPTDGKSGSDDSSSHSAAVVASTAPTISTSSTNPRSTTSEPVFCGQPPLEVGDSSEDEESSTSVPDEDVRFSNVNDDAEPPTDDTLTGAPEPTNVDAADAGSSPSPPESAYPIPLDESARLADEDTELIAADHDESGEMAGTSGYFFERLNTPLTAPVEPLPQPFSPSSSLVVAPPSTATADVDATDHAYDHHDLDDRDVTISSSHSIDSTNAASYWFPCLSTVFPNWVATLTVSPMVATPSELQQRFPVRDAIVDVRVGGQFLSGQPSLLQRLVDKLDAGVITADTVIRSLDIFVWNCRSGCGYWLGNAEGDVMPALIGIPTVVRSSAPHSATQKLEMTTALLSCPTVRKFVVGAQPFLRLLIRLVGTLSFFPRNVVDLAWSEALIGASIHRPLSALTVARDLSAYQRHHSGAAGCAPNDLMTMEGGDGDAFDSLEQLVEECDKCAIETRVHERLAHIWRRCQSSRHAAGAIAEPSSLSSPPEPVDMRPAGNLVAWIRRAFSPHAAAFVERMSHVEVRLRILNTVAAELGYFDGVASCDSASLWCVAPHPQTPPIPPMRLVVSPMTLDVSAEFIASMMHTHGICVQMPPDDVLDTLTQCRDIAAAYFRTCAGWAVGALNENSGAWVVVKEAWRARLRPQEDDAVGVQAAAAASVDARDVWELLQSHGAIIAPGTHRPPSELSALHAMRPVALRGQSLLHALLPSDHQAEEQLGLLSRCRRAASITDRFATSTTATDEDGAGRNMGDLCALMSFWYVWMREASGHLQDVDHLVLSGRRVVVDGKDSCEMRQLHPQWIHKRSTTGRIFSVRPNVQTLPKLRPSHHSSLIALGEASQACPLRSLLRGPAGTTLISLDYGQMELRVLAHLSGDRQLAALLCGGGDVFALIAERMTSRCRQGAAPSSRSSSLWSVSTKEATTCRLSRQAAKTLVYSILYGMSAEGVALQLEDLLVNQTASSDNGTAVAVASEADVKQLAREAVHGFFREFWQVDAFLSAIRSDATRFGVARGLLRTRTLRRSPASCQGEGDLRQLQREATSFVIQGSAADIVKLALLRVSSHLSTAFALSAGTAAMQQHLEGGAHHQLPPLPAALVSTAHDEVMFAVPNCHPQSVEAMRRWLEQQLAAVGSYLQLSVPLVVRTTVSDTFPMS